MRWLKRIRKFQDHTNEIVAENDAAIQEIRAEKEAAQAETPALAARAEMLLNRGKENHYGEALMLSYRVRGLGH